jgi:quercetin dioxygenase-like cupin family protein
MPIENPDAGRHDDGTSTMTGNAQQRSLAEPILEFDLQSELQRLRAQNRYTSGVPAGATLVKHAALRIVLMAMARGARMDEHHASGPISIQGLEGRCRLTVREESIDLKAGTLVVLDANVPHNVEAIEDSAFLLTIGSTTYQDVSDHHERHP